MPGHVPYQEARWADWDGVAPVHYNTLDEIAQFGEVFRKIAK